MKIGILDCDVLSDAMQLHGFTSYGEAFEKMLTSIEPSNTYLHYQVTRGDLPERVKECDAYIISGSQHSANQDTPWINALKQFITKLNNNKKRPMAGICFGHQVIASALGGQVELAVSGWGVGVKSFEILQYNKSKHPDWMEPYTSTIALPMSHQEQVTALPPNATILASSDYCPIAAYCIESHIIGIQGHPEFTREYLAALINSRKEQLGKSVVKNGLNSLEEKTDSVIVALWLLRFFEQHQ